MLPQGTVVRREQASIVRPSQPLGSCLSPRRGWPQGSCSWLVPEPWASWQPEPALPVPSQACVSLLPLATWAGGARARGS